LRSVGDRISLPTSAAAGPKRNRQLLFSSLAQDVQTMHTPVFSLEFENLNRRPKK
jgi:hypothetical protein